MILYSVLSSKVVVITGASSGIGLALAKAFGSRKSTLVLAARSIEKLQILAEELSMQFNIAVLPILCDVSKEKDCQLLMEQTLKRYGKIDILINNAGISMRALFNDLNLAVLEQLMQVNFWGTVYCTKYAFPALRQSGGSIVAISSIAGYRGLPGRTGYSASKFAVNGFMESLRVENLKTGMHVMVACPGFTASNIRMTALDKNAAAFGETSMEEGKMMSAEEVAERILKGIVAKKRTVIMSRQGKLAVLLNKIIPSWVDKQVFKLFAKEKNPLI